MKFGDLDSDSVLDIMQLWDFYLGSQDTTYLQHPGKMVSEVADPHSWLEVAGSSGKVRTYRPKIESRYSRDTKLSCTLIDGRLEMECQHPGEHYIDPTKRIEAFKAQEKFNRDVREYLSAR